MLRMTAPVPGVPVREQLTAGLDAYLEYVETHAHGYRAFHRADAAGDQAVRRVYRRALGAQERQILAALAADPEFGPVLERAGHPARGAGLAGVHHGGLSGVAARGAVGARPGTGPLRACAAGRPRALSAPGRFRKDHRGRLACAPIFDRLGKAYLRGGWDG